MYSIARLIALLALWPLTGLLLLALLVTQILYVAEGENQLGLIGLSIALSLSGFLFFVISLFHLLVLKRRQDIGCARLMRAHADRLTGGGEVSRRVA